MPYVNNLSRERVDRWLKGEPVLGPTLTKGELNCALTLTTMRWLRERTKEVGRLKYCIMHDAMGALECAKLEFYRRMVAEYEDEKIKEHGDVY